MHTVWVGRLLSRRVEKGKKGVATPGVRSHITSRLLQHLTALVVV